MEILVVAPEKGPLLYRFIFTKGGMSRLRSFVSRTAGIVRKEAARQLIERVAKLNFQCAELTQFQRLLQPVQKQITTKRIREVQVPTKHISTKN
jgi:hypothetical protein